MKKIIITLLAACSLYSCTKAPNNVLHSTTKIDTIASYNWTISTENFDYDTITGHLFLDTTLYAYGTLIDSIGRLHADSVVNSWSVPYHVITYAWHTTNFPEQALTVKAWITN